MKSGETLEMNTWKESLRFRWPAVGALMLIAGWTFHTHSIVPLQERERQIGRAAATLKEQIGDALRVIEEVRALEAQMSRERNELASHSRNLPAGPALVWFPEWMKQHFARSGITGVATRLNTQLDETELPDFERTYWAAQLSAGNTSSDMRNACLAIAEIEPLEPSIRVLDVAIRRDPDDPTRHLAVINVSVLSQKRELSD